MDRQFYTVDVFTDQVFEGAQIAVFPEADGLDDHTMQRMANEFNLSETVFVFSPNGKDDRYPMRTFSPLQEIDFAGHPIIATAFVLAKTGKVQLNALHTPIILGQKTTDIGVSISQKDGEVELIQFSLNPQSIVDRFVPHDQEIADFLSLSVKEIESKKYQPMMVSCGFPYLIIPIRTFDAVRKAKFNYQNWSQSVAPSTSAQEIFLFSSHTRHTVSNFHGRIVGPDIGIREDPPIGSAIPAFTSYLCSHDQVVKGTYTFAIDRGEDGNRRSLLHIEMDNKGPNQLKIRVGGKAVLVSQGSMRVPG